MMFASTAWPTEAGVREAPTMAMPRGSKRGRSDATEPMWSRASRAPAYVSAGPRSTITSYSEPLTTRRTPNPRVASRFSIGRFSISTSASRRWNPSARADSASRSTSRMPTPSPWSWSLTTTASSARPGSVSGM